ncbi:MAG TPA: hypothetical protein VK186_00350 [Candidatus Deferrimicrobium sp.]|nr:hypothetical protein [Candidatus Kapabacteria bacterium]HLP57240.1 hypothetical protein [Candidatus Deferrimicrobium sp.]
MSKKRMTVLLFIICMAIFITITFAGCKKNSEPLGPLSGWLVKYEGCKQTATANNNRGEEVLSTAGNDCLEFNYDGAGTLALKHIDAGFNCCPGTLTADIAFNGNQITITEKESQQGCHCSCLFDLFYELKNVSPGAYTIRIIEPYIPENDPVMVFTLELTSAKSGTLCVERNHYPWI